MIRRTAAVSLVAAVSVAVAPTAASQSAGAGFEETSAGFVLPDDELFQQQWYLFNHSQEIGGVATGVRDADIHAPEAWAITTGSPDVVVAVLDTGVDVDHPDLAPNIWHNPGELGDGKESNGVDDDGNGYIDDYQGWDFLQNDNVPQGLRSNDNEAGSPIEHGTAVASLIAAAGGDGTGMAGIAPNVRIMPLRGLGSEQQITEAIAYAIDNGAHIVNLSFGSPGVLGAGEAYKGLIEANPQVLFVGGTGNSALDIDNPNGFVPCTLPYDNVLCVAGTDPSDALWFVERGSGSNYGATGADIAAPAAEMLVAQPPLTPIFSDDFESGLASWAVTATQGDEFVADEGFVPVPGEGAWVIAPGMGRDGGDAAAVFGWDAGNQIHLQPVEVDPFPAATACSFSLWINVDGMSAGANKVLIEERATAEGRWGFGFGGLLVTANAAGDGWQQWTTGAGRYGEPDEQWRITLDGFSGGPDDVVLIDDVEVVCQLGDYSDVRANYMYSQGTSFATPLAAGVAALVLSEYPTLTGAEVKQAIMDGARVLPALADTSLTGGRLDAYGALLAAAEIVRNGAASSSATGAGAGATDDTVAVGVGDAGEGEIPPMPLPGLPPCRGCPVPGADEEGEPFESATGPSGSESAPSDDVEGDAGVGEPSELLGGDGATIGAAPETSPPPGPAPLVTPNENGSFPNGLVAVAGTGLFVLFAGGSYQWYRRRSDGSLDYVGATQEAPNAQNYSEIVPRAGNQALGEALSDAARNIGLTHPGDSADGNVVGGLWDGAKVVKRGVGVSKLPAKVGSVKRSLQLGAEAKEAFAQANVMGSSGDFSFSDSFDRYRNGATKLFAAEQNAINTFGKVPSGSLSKAFKAMDAVEVAKGPPPIGNGDPAAWLRYEGKVLGTASVGFAARGMPVPAAVTGVASSTISAADLATDVLAWGIRSAITVASGP